MATFWERVAHSVYHMFSLCFDLLWFLLFHTLVLRTGLGSDCISSWSFLIFFYFLFFLLFVIDVI